MKRIQIKWLYLMFVVLFMNHCGPDQQQESTNWISSPSLNELMAPQNLSVLCDDSQHLVLTWEVGDTTATHFSIERKTANEAFAVISEVEADPVIENYHDAVDADVEYTYRVQGILKNADGSVDYVSQYSNEVSGIADDRCDSVIYDSQGNPISLQ